MLSGRQSKASISAEREGSRETVGREDVMQLDDGNMGLVRWLKKVPPEKTRLGEGSFFIGTKMPLLK